MSLITDDSGRGHSFSSINLMASKMSISHPPVKQAGHDNTAFSEDVTSQQPTTNHPTQVKLRQENSLVSLG